MNLDRAGEVGAQIGAIAGALIGLGVLAKTIVLRPLLHALDERIEQVLHELRPNNGQSLRDAVDRLGARVDGIDSRQVSMEARQKSVQTGLAEHGIGKGDES